MNFDEVWYGQSTLELQENVKLSHSGVV